MPTKKLNKKDLKDLVLKIESKIDVMKTRGMVKTLLEFQNLPSLEKHAIRQEWDLYFSRVYETPIHDAFVLMKTAFQNNDMTEVRRMRKEIAKLKISGAVLKKPRYEDPLYLESCAEVQEYKQLKYKLSRLKEELNEDSYVDDVSEFLGVK